jgi:mRNA interferase HicA
LAQDGSSGFAVVYIFVYDWTVSSEELKRWLKKQGCSFGRQEGSHLKVYRGDKFTILPMHGKKEIKSGTLKAILRDLDLNL